MKSSPRSIAGLALGVAIGCMTVPAHAESLFQALVSTYSNNPTLNAARAGQRAQNENVSIAKAGRRPTVASTGQIGRTSTRTFNPAGIFNSTTNDDFTQGNAGFSVQQNLFNGFQNKNNIRAAKSGVKAGAQALKNVEQTVLVEAVTAYTDVLRDREILTLQERDVSFSREQVRASRAQARVGEGTRTDVALAEADLASALSALAAAKSALKASEASYVEVIGHQPGGLSAPTDASRHLPKSLKQAIKIARHEHPLIRSAQHNVDAGQFNVRVSEGTLLPGVSLNGTYQKSFQAGTIDSNSDTGSVTVDISVPLYQGGSRFATIRQSKETVSQLRIQVDESRRSVIQGVRASWASLESARSQIRSARSNVRASQVAVQGLVEERKVGQATTLDVLTAQSNSIAAQVSLANAQRDSIVASYSLLASIGRFTGQNVQIAQHTNVKEPTYHYQQVKDRWVGLRTPSGN